MTTDRPTPDILFHIGLHKTATSLLQRHLFTEENGYRPVPRREILATFVDKFSTEGPSAAELDRLDGLSAAAAADGLLAVASHERLHGYPATGCYDRRLILGRIASVRQRPRILVVIREQRSWIYSMWKQSIVDGSHLSLSRFLDEDAHVTRRVPAFSFAAVDFLRLHDALLELFGGENVLMLPYELYAAEPEAFLSRIAGFTGRPGPAAGFGEAVVNSSRTVAHLLALRWLHRHVFRTSLSKSGLLDIRNARSLAVYEAARRACAASVGRTRRLDHRAEAHRSYIQRRVADRFRASNAELAKRIGLDLRSYGYD
jgi:hypothetical protein